MKVKCVINDYTYPLTKGGITFWKNKTYALTIGKIYEAEVNLDESLVFLIDDENKQRGYDPRMFVKVTE